MKESSGGLVLIIGIGLAIAAYFMLKKRAEETDPTVAVQPIPPAITASPDIRPLAPPDLPPRGSLTTFGLSGVDISNAMWLGTMIPRSELRV